MRRATATVTNSPLVAGPRRLGRAGAALAAVGILVSSAVGCSSSGSSPPMFATTDIPITVTEFRIRLNDFTEHFVAVVDHASETIIDTSSDQTVRRHAMEFRLRAVNAFLNALNQPDPVASLADAWVLCLQLEEYVSPGGVGAEIFGDSQPVMIDATQGIVTEVESVINLVTLGQVAPETTALVYQWAAEEPLSTTMLVRSSTAVRLAEQIENGTGGAFAALNRLQAGVDDLVSQYERYISVMPRTIRWQSQLILHETLYDELDLGETMESFDLVKEHVAALNELAAEVLADLPNRDELEAEFAAAMAGLQAIVDAEREKLLLEIDRQRGLIFDDVDLQREAIMRDVEAQIALVDEQIEGRLFEVFDQIEELTNDTLEKSFSESERLVNLVYLRVLTLLLIGLAGGAGLMVLKKWLYRPGPATPDA